MDNLVSFFAYNSVRWGEGGRCLYPVQERNNFCLFSVCGEIVGYFGSVT